MFNRVCIIVLDSVGIGAMPDAAEYGDTNAHTLGNILKLRERLHLPNLYNLGLGNITGSRLPTVDKPTGAYGRMAEMTRAKDTTSGHWEMMGLIMDSPFKVVEKFPDDMLKEWLRRTGREEKWLGNLPASGTHIIDQLGQAHMETSAPIVYTSADSVFQVAAHEEIIPLPELYKLCEIARKMLEYGGPLSIGRVIARPFTGTPGNFSRTENRRDYAVPPVGRTLLDALEEHRMTTLGIGKIEDIFCNQGVTHVNHTTNNKDGISATIEALKSNNLDTLIFTNLVDFDMKYGHRNDPEGYAQALEHFDSELPKIQAALRPHDLLIITADHGCDPTTASTDHSREYVPLLVSGGEALRIKPVDLNTRRTFADIAITLAEGLKIGSWPVGESFLSEIL